MALTTDVVAFDLETTGVDPHTDRIVSAAIVGRDLHTFITRPGVPIPWDAARVHGITDYTLDLLDQKVPGGGVLANGTGVVAIARQLLYYVRSPIVGHNVRYDLTMLYHECIRHGIDGLATRLTDLVVIDTYLLDQMLSPKHPGRRTLSDAYKRWVGHEIEDAHRAETDAVAALSIYVSMIDALEHQGYDNHTDLHEAQGLYHRGIQELRARRFQQEHRPDLFDPCWPICLGDHAPATVPARTRAVTSLDTVSWDDL